MTVAADDVDGVDGVEDEVGGRHPDRRRLIALMVGGVVACWLVLTWLIGFSSVFGVRGVAVAGTNVLTAGQVRAAAAIKGGTPLVRVDTVAVTRRVEKLPDVASAQVSTSFPSTVRITVVERQPVAYVETAGRATLIDRTGARYRTVGSAPVNLPKLVATPSRRTDAALASVAAALPAAIRAQVRSIQALDPQSITLLLHGDRLVRWGSAARTGDKARILPVLLRGLRGKDNQIDVTDPDRPFTH